MDNKHALKTPGMYKCIGLDRAVYFSYDTKQDIFKNVLVLLKYLKPSIIMTRKHQDIQIY